MSKARIASVTVNTEAGTLSFNFAHGASLTVSLSDLSLDIRHRLAIHGLEQKIRDSYAGASSPDEAYGLASKTVDALRAGNWTVRGSSEPRPDSTEVLAQAVCAAAAAAGKLLDPEAVKAKIRGLDRSALARLRSDPRVAAELARLRGKSQNVLEDLF
jgi:hypothetical protein